MSPEFRPAGGWCLRFAVLASFLVGSSAWSEVAPVFSPASVYDRAESVPNGPPDQGSDPTLVVVGEAKAIDAKRPNAYPGLRLEIGEVLFGDLDAKAVDFSSGSLGKGIFSLTPNSWSAGPPYELAYERPVDHLPAARALAEARLEMLVLNATSVVVGEEGNAGAARPPQGQREVKVLEILSGPAFPEKATILLRGKGEKSGVPQLYFLQPPPFVRSDERTVYECTGVLPMNNREKVVALLRSPKNYPVVDDPENRYTHHFREIVFDGTTDQALAMLGSENQAEAILGERYFYHHSEEARTRLVPLIEADLLKSEPAKDHEFERQKAYIFTLGRAERKATAGASAELAEKLIAALEKSPATVPPREHGRTWANRHWGWGWLREEEITDTNHSLVWLLQQLPEAQATQRWGERLLALKTHLDGWWQQEVALAVEVLRLESDRELEAGFAAMKAITPVRSVARLHQAGGVDAVSFSPDGSLLATSAEGDLTQIWSARDWHSLAVIPRGAKRLAFSPDGKFLYLSGGTRTGEIFARYEWAPGRLDRTYSSPTGWIDRMELSRDGSVMLTASYMDGSLILWDTATGEKLRTELLPKISAAATLSNDGKRIARPRKETGVAGQMEIVVESLDGKQTVCEMERKGEVTRLAFTSDDSGLVLLGSGSIELHDLDGKGNLRARAECRFSFYNGLVLSPDGRLAVCSDEAGHASVYTLPDLQLAWSGYYHLRDWAQSVAGMAFSPDGRWMVLGNREPTPHLLRTENFEEITPYEGHPGRTEAIGFSADNHRLWSYGDDGSLCHWDAETMKMIDRQGAPEGRELISVSVRDGAFALYCERSEREGGSSKPRPEKKATIIESISGRVVSTIDLSLPAYGMGIYWLPGGRFLLGNGATATLIDFLHGKVLWKVPSKFLGTSFFVSTDQSSVLTGGMDKGGEYFDTTIDLATGEIRAVRVDDPGDMVNLGGKTYLPGVRRDRPKKMPLVRGFEVLDVVLSPDRKRLAVMTGQKLSADGGRAQEDAPASAVIRIHDAESLRMIGAIQSSGSVHFNADASQLAIGHADGTIERWSLPR